MGKIKIVGKAEHEYQPDQCNIYICFQSTKRTSDTASKYVNDQCEKFLSELFDKGFASDSLVIISDGVNPQTDSIFRDDDSPKEILYKASRGIRLTVPAEQNVINTVRDITENGYKNVAFSTDFMISNESELKKHLIKEAVADSKAQASFLAESMGQKIIGIDSANLSGSSEFLPSEKEDDLDINCPMFLRAASHRPLSDKLKSNTIKLSAEVNIVWEIDSE